MAAIVVLPSLPSNDAKTYRIGLAGAVPAGMSEALAAQANAAGVRARTMSYDSPAAGEQAVRDRKVDVLLVDGATLEWRRQSDARLTTLLGNAVQALRIRDRAAMLGLSTGDVRGLLEPAALSSNRIGTLAPTEDNAQDVGLIAVALMLFAISIYGATVLTGVAQEKSSRIAEVLLSRIRPRELLAGKVLGIGALGLGQFALVLVTAAACLAVVRSTDTPHVATPVWVWLVVWFMLGYTLYSVVYAALGALASRVEDASSAAAPVSVVLFACYFAALAALESPDSPMATVLSFVPASAPLVMPMRLTLTPVPVVQVVASAMLTAATIWILLRAAGRIYAGALLRTGVRIPLRVAWRGGGTPA